MCKVTTLKIKTLMKVSIHLRSRETTNRPPKRPLDIFLQQGVFLFNTVPNKKPCTNWSEK